MRWIEEYLDGGGTLILVSHSMYHVQKLCRHACWLRDGRVEQYGDVFDVTQAYLAYHERKSAPVRRARRDCARRLRVQRARRRAEWRRRRRRRLRSTSARRCASATRIRSRDGRVPSRRDRHRARRRHAGLRRRQRHGRRGARVRPGNGEYVAEIEFPDLALLPGAYAVRVHPLDPEGVRLFDTVERGVRRARRLARVRPRPARPSLARRASRRRDRSLGALPAAPNRAKISALSPPFLRSRPFDGRHRSPALPFTGERFTPECVREIWYEHWHRYLFAWRIAQGKRVLDAACGEGYGSALLARTATRRARRRHRRPASIAHARDALRRARESQFRSRRRDRRSISNRRASISSSRSRRSSMSRRRSACSRVSRAR